MRCKMLLPMLLSSLFVLAASPVFSQAPTPPAARLEAMKRFDLWVGEWKGSGWVSPGGDGRHEFRIDEKVQRKLGGTVLLVEGRGTRRTDKGQEVVTHEALALLYYDDKAGRYHWHSHDLRGGVIDVEPKLVDGGFEWGFRVEERGVTVRFTIRFDEKRWHELGETSADGKTWNKFLEMTLERQR
jgi:hypothetical protein